MTTYDWLLARRTAALGIALGALVFLVMLGTDEVGSSLSGRLARLAALVSLAGGGGAFLATEQARSRGEMRALAAVGVNPARGGLGAIVGGTLIGALGPALLLFGRVDLNQLFPRLAPSAGIWVLRGNAWFESTRGVLVQATGELSVASKEPGLSLPSIAPGSPRWAILLALTLAAFGAPLWAVASGPVVRRAAVALGVAGASVPIYHLVAAGRAGPLALAFPPALLLLDAWALHRSQAWS